MSQCVALRFMYACVGGCGGRRRRGHLVAAPLGRWHPPAAFVSPASQVLAISPHLLPGAACFGRPVPSAFFSSGLHIFSGRRAADYFADAMSEQWAWRNIIWSTDTWRRASPSGSILPRTRWVSLCLCGGNGDEEGGRRRRSFCCCQVCSWFVRTSAATTSACRRTSRAAAVSLYQWPMLRVNVDICEVQLRKTGAAPHAQVHHRIASACLRIVLPNDAKPCLLC